MRRPTSYVLLTEAREGYAYRLRAIGHLLEAGDESQEWPDLHAAIREARKACQVEGTVRDWDAPDGMLEGVRKQARRGLAWSLGEIQGQLLLFRPCRHLKGRSTMSWSGLASCAASLWSVRSGHNAARRVRVDIFLT